ncbi:MAG: hypothetical protein RLZZ08_1145 [Pseudomonadota bacterium]|jgi:osmotically-inducible protein OsmY
MADRNSDYRSDRRSRWSTQHNDRDQSPWQQEQFESGNRGWRDDGQGSQMGETRNQDADRWSRSNQYGRSPTGAMGSQDSTRGYGGSSDYDASGYQNQGRTYGSFTSDDFGGRDFAGSSWNTQPGMGARMGGAGYAGGGYGSSSSDQHNRGFLDRAGDEVASWFGDKEASRRREDDHSGRGPANYTRSDARILEDACDRITDDPRVDGRNIQVTVDEGEVTLDGKVASRDQKRRAEDCVDAISGVKHVQNNLRVEMTSGSDNIDAEDATKSAGPFI